MCKEDFLKKQFCHLDEKPAHIARVGGNCRLDKYLYRTLCPIEKNTYTFQNFSPVRKIPFSDFL